MKNKKKTLLALLLGVLLVAAALVLTIFLLRRQEEASGPVQSLSREVLTVDVAEVASLAVQGADGESYRLELNGSYSGTLEGVDPEVGLDTMTLSLFVSKFTSIRSYHDPIALGSGNTLADYGLAEPFGSVVIEKLDGTSLKVLVGDQTVKKNGYYLHVEGSDTVHVVENAYYEYLKYSRDDYIDRQLAAVDQEDGFTITQLSIRNRERDYDAITVRMRFGQYEDNSIYLYEVVEPEYHSADDNKIQENVFTYLNPLKGKAVYSLDTSEENLAALGLAEPQYILSYINEGIEREFWFTQLESGKVLGMKAGGKVILEMDSSLLHMLQIQVADVSNAYVLLQSISELDHFVVRLEGETYDFALSSEEGALTGAAYRGRELDVEEFRQLYSLGLDIKIAGDMSDPEEKGELLLNLTYRCTDGTEHSVDYYSFDGRYCYVTLNGSGRFLVRLSAIEDFVEYLHTLTAAAAE